MSVSSRVTLSQGPVEENQSVDTSHRDQSLPFESYRMRQINQMYKPLILESIDGCLN